ncbi:MAG: chromate efflux transporter [Bacteroidota bacterium]|nr:chromate efflux transporter [Bacteroidota bacterium]
MGDLIRLFLKLGFIGFGGPAAAIAMMEDEVVVRRRWLSREHFLDLVGATNLIPGPNSTEMALHIGYERKGYGGLLVAGWCFILPAALMTGVLGWLYMAYGQVPALEPFLAGIKPAVIVIILGALWRLGKTAVRQVSLVPIGAAVAAALLLGVNEVLALIGGGLLGLAGLYAWRRRTVIMALPLIVMGVLQSGQVEYSLLKLGLFFLKVGSVLYGSGYVLIAFLDGDLVQTYGWLSEQQLLDAVAIGQFTPGPVLTTATFIGVMLGGWQGGLVATVAIFLPSFIFVSILNPLIPRLRKSKITAAFLDAINVSAVALMLVVTVRLGLAVLTGWSPWIVFGLAALATWRFRLHAGWLVAGGAAAGYLLGELSAAF